jgi:hypothetical protein
VALNPHRGPRNVHCVNISLGVRGTNLQCVAAIFNELWLYTAKVKKVCNYLITGSVFILDFNRGFIKRSLTRTSGKSW